MRQTVVHLTLAAMLALAAGTTQAQNAPLQQPPVVKPAPDAPPPPPPKPDVEPLIQEGPAYDITSFQFRYATDHPDRPALEEFLRLPVTLSESSGVLSAPGGVGQQVTLKLEDLASSSRGSRKFSVSAINAIGAVIVKDLNARGLIGVLVSPDPTQIDPQSLRDLRPSTNRSLTLDIWTRTVKQVRTLGQGERWARPNAPRDLPSEETRINSKYHERIRNSPLQPGVNGQPGDLLRKDVLDDYLFELNRHPGRRVDGAIAASDTPGEIVLDYIVTENRPWTIYFQVSNTGTEQTSDWRERFGFTHNQLLNKDDTLSIDVITASFNEANSVTVNYDSPFGTSEVLRYKLYGSASEFKASDVGFADEQFKGDSWNIGAELSANVWQRHQSFIDIFGGIRYEHEKVNNEAVLVRGETDFFIPYVGARFERTTDKASTTADVRVEHNIGTVATDEDQLDSLGRLFTDRDWTALKWDFSTAFFLEPLIFRSDWSNPNAPYKHTTLAHEVALSVRGQYAFDHRLIPQEEFTAGGLYSVRGYDESAVAGDNAIVATAEYRYHVPRAMAVRDPGTLAGKPFRWAPDQRYGRPDWDLVLKGFTDAARTTNSDKQSFESDATMWSVGVGAEILYQRNISLRMDWGVALHDAASTNSGDSRVHIVATFLY